MLEISELLGKLTEEDIEKLKILSSIFNGGLQPKLKEINLIEAITEYEKFAEFNLAPKTTTLIKTANRRILKFFPGNKSLITFQRKDAENLLVKIAQTAPLGVYNYLRIYKAEFNVFIEWNYLIKTPFENVKLPKRQKEETIAFDEIQIELCCEELRRTGKQTIADMVEFSKYTALRAGEVTSLMWEDINMAEMVIRVGSKTFKTKSRKKRIVPMNDRVVQIVNKNKLLQNNNGNKKSEYVFAQRNGQPYKVDTISKKLKYVIRNLGLPEELHWHSLRAAAASLWVSKRVPIYTVSKLLGHSDVKVTSRYYANVDVTELRNAVNTL